jgi:hypothetical protein
MAHVGADRYAAAREQAWRTAAGRGRSPHPRTLPARDAGAELLGSVVYDLAELTWYARERPEPMRLALALALYRELPSYTVLMWGTAAYRECGTQTRQAFWAAYRALLGDPDDRLADPVGYSLWCDDFEDSDTVQEVWEGLEPRTLPARGPERLLEVAGPVPWALTAPLYQQLLPDRSWHRAIFRSLLASRLDGYGQIDAPKALRLLDRLRLTRHTEGLAELRARLEAECRTSVSQPKRAPPRRRSPN